MNKYKKMADPMEVESYFDGIEYPATKEEIIDTSRVNGAPKEVIEVLVEIDDLEYTNPTEVEVAIKCVWI